MRETRRSLAHYHNPVWPDGFADPFVLKVRGRYYAYATESEAHPAADAQVFPILTSTDLIHWEEVGKALSALGAEYFFYWAPEVTAYNGQYFLYYAVHTSEFAASIRVAVADRPEGPFLDSGRELTSHLISWAIDPHVLRTQDGQWYLYMTIEYTQEANGYVGSGNAVVRLADPFTTEGPLTRVTVPAHQWELFEAKRPEKGGVDWYTVEGPAVFQHRRQYYQMFSGGCYYKDNYAVSYATADRPMGAEGMADTTWQDWAGPTGTEREQVLLRGNRDHLLGPGHNSVVPGPNNADRYIAYHAWQPDMQQRRPCIDRLFFHGDQLWTNAPVHQEQTAPSLPRFRELFEQPGLAQSWQVETGNWSVREAAVIQEESTLARAVLHQETPLEAAWLLEVNARAIAGTGGYGVLLTGRQRSLQITMTAEAQLVFSTGRVGDPAIQSVPLNWEVQLQAWQQLVLTFSGSLLHVQCDSRPALTIEIDFVPQTFSLVTENCQAAFSGISLTDHFRDEFLEECYTPTQLGWKIPMISEPTSISNWLVQADTLVQTNVIQGEQTLLKGPLLAEFEFGASMRLNSPHHEDEAAIGILAHYSEQEQLYIRLIEQSANWALAVESAGLSPVINHVIALPATFDVTAWHTLRLVQEQNDVHISLDGPDMLTIRDIARPARPGLATRNTSAAFTSVWQTGK